MWRCVCSQTVFVYEMLPYFPAHDVCKTPICAPFLQEEPDEIPPPPEPIKNAQQKSGIKQQSKTATAQLSKTATNKSANAAQPSKAAAPVQQNKNPQQNKTEQPAKTTPQKNVASQKVSVLPYRCDSVVESLHTCMRTRCYLGNGKKVKLMHQFEFTKIKCIVNI